MNSLPTDRIENIRQAVKSYAEAYRLLEKLQKAEKDYAESEQLLPWHGDQKTGLIGEYWAIQFARHLYPNAISVRFSRTNQKGWDIGIQLPHSNSERLVQVKTTSSFSKTGRLSPVHSPRSIHVEGEAHESWDELWVVQLDEKLFPIGFWSLNEEDLIAVVRDQAALNQKSENEAPVAQPEEIPESVKKSKSKKQPLKTSAGMFFPMSGITIPKDHKLDIKPEWLGKSFTARHQEFCSAFRTGSK